MGILIDNLSKSFGDKCVISNLSCTLPERGIVKISGASGAGKTTLTRIIAGLDKEYSGSISGVGSVSCLFQEHRLFPWISALDNVVIAAFDQPNSESKLSAEKMLARLGLTPEEYALKPGKLSGGMKQRVSIARALLKDADVLILDEPTKELDAKLVEIVTAMINEAAQSRLVLLVSHDSALDSLDFACEIPI